MPEKTRGATLRRAIETVLEPDDESVAGLGDLCTEDVVVWSPNMLTSGLAGLVENLAFRQGAFTDVKVHFDSVGVFGSKAVVELRVSATFSGPFVIEDEVVIDPNGQQLLLGAAVIADFEGDKIKGMRAYFDDATLLEQMLPA